MGRKCWVVSHHKWEKVLSHLNVTINRRVTPQIEDLRISWMLTFGFKYKLGAFSNVNVIVKEENDVF